MFLIFPTSCKMEKCYIYWRVLCKAVTKHQLEQTKKTLQFP